MPLVFARGVAIIIAISVDAWLLFSWFRRRCCWRIVRIFFVGTKLAIPQLQKYLGLWHS
jgi:hypothetical protein